MSDLVLLSYNAPFSCSEVIKILCLILHPKAFVALMKAFKNFFLNCFKIKFKLSRHTVSFHHLEKLAENTYSDLRALQSLKFPREYAYWVLCPTGSKCVDSARPGDLGGHGDVTMLGNVLGRNPKGMAMVWKL